MGRMRLRLIGLGVVMAVTLSMAACGGGNPEVSPSTTATEPATELPAKPTPTDKPSASTTLEGVTATGGFDEEPVVTFDKKPWAIESTSWEIVVQGEGSIVPTDALVQVNYQGVNARTGDVFDSSYTRKAPSTLALYNMIPGFAKGVTGQKVGTRMILAIPGADGYDGVSGNKDIGIEIGDTLVFVIDILRSQVANPEGENVTVTNANLPKVSGTLEAPTLTIASGSAPPSTLVVQPLIKGTGPVAAKGDLVVINYAEYVWGTGAMVRQSYGYYPLSGDLSQLIEGWQQAIAGTAMGTRLLLVVPAALSYPEGNPRFGIPSGSTMVYVLDLLYAAPMETGEEASTETATPTPEATVTPTPSATATTGKKK